MTPAQNLPSWRSRIGILAVTSITVLALAGCSGTEASGAPTSEISSTPNAEPTPMFASDDEALAAAELAYRNYIAVSDEIARDGGKSPERIHEFVTADLYLQAVEEFSYFSNHGVRASGQTSFDSFRIQSVEVIDGRQHIRAYVCLDVSNNRLLDSFATDVTPADRPSRVPLEILFLVAPSKENSVLLATSDVWSGTNFC